MYPGVPPQQHFPGAYPPPQSYPAAPAFPGAYPGAPWPPMLPPQQSRGGTAVVAALAAVALVGGGAFAYHHFYGRGASAVSCTVAGAPTLAFDRKSDSEPTVTIPARSGWVTMRPDQIPGASAAASDPSIHGIVVNKGIQANGFVPNVVVTLDRHSGQSPTPEMINDLEDQHLARTTTIVNRTSQISCGETVFATDFIGLDTSGDGRTQAGSSLLTTADAPDGSRWVATATIQTRDAGNPEYIAQRDALVRGFHVAFPAV